MFASLCCGACQAFSHVPPGGCRSCFMCLRGSVVGLVLTVQNTCGVLNPVQGHSHFLRLCLCMRVCFCCFYGSSGIKAHVVRTAVKILCSPIASFAPWVALLPPVKCWQNCSSLVLQPVSSSLLPADRVFSPSHATFWAVCPCLSVG